MVGKNMHGTKTTYKYIINCTDSDKTVHNREKYAKYNDKDIQNYIQK